MRGKELASHSHCEPVLSTPLGNAGEVGCPAVVLRDGPAGHTAHQKSLAWRSDMLDLLIGLGCFGVSPSTSIGAATISPAFALRSSSRNAAFVCSNQGESTAGARRI